jgi:hypothetical protein
MHVNQSCTKSSWSGVEAYACKLLGDIMMTDDGEDAIENSNGGEGS